MEKSSKNSTLTNQWKIILAIFLIVVGMFYWHQIRPSMIYSECHRLATESAQEVHYEHHIGWLKELEGFSAEAMKEWMLMKIEESETPLLKNRWVSHYREFYNLSAEEIKRQIKIREAGYFNKERYEFFFKQCLRREGIIRD